MIPQELGLERRTYPQHQHRNIHGLKHNVNYLGTTTYAERSYLGLNTYQLWSIVGMTVILATHLDDPGRQGGCRQGHRWEHNQGADEAKAELQKSRFRTLAFLCFGQKSVFQQKKSFCHGISEENPCSWVTRAKKLCI